MVNLLGSALILLFLILFSNCLRFYLAVNLLSEELENQRYGCFFLRNVFVGVNSVRGLDGGEVHSKGLPVKRLTDAIEMTIANENQIKKVILYVGQSPLNPLNSSLFMKQQGKPRIETIAKIVDMRALYGLKCAKSQNVCGYVGFSSGIDWSQVISLKLTLFSKDNLIAKPWSVYIAIKKKH
ncbi:MAG: hypothetical protein H0U71_02145 [Gammaproteobacteria bacterium]|nr:hypothetical protein [Gammaproteobacteria bacterium]